MSGGMTPQSPFPMVDTPGHISESALDKMFEGEPLLTNAEVRTRAPA